VVSTYQLIEIGLSPDSIKRRDEAGRLHREFQGVYAVGHAGLSREGRWMAAVLACRGREDGAGSEAFLSHLSAARLWQLLPSPAGFELVDVAVIGENGRKRQPGLRIHRPRTLEDGMTTRKLGIPVTDPRRTIADLHPGKAEPGRCDALPATTGDEAGSGSRPSPRTGHQA
jgi:hypothetical protein